MRGVGVDVVEVSRPMDGSFGDVFLHEITLMSTDRILEERLRWAIGIERSDQEREWRLEQKRASLSFDFFPFLSFPFFCK